MAGPLKNQKHESFCRGVVAGKAAYIAYREAGYTGNDDTLQASASRLLADARIAGRIAELAGKAAEKTVEKIALTKDWVVQEMIGAAMDAKTDRQHSPRIRALELLGRETGNFTERKQLTVRSFAEMTAEEIEEFLAGQSEPAGPKKADRRRQGGTGKAKAGSKRKG